MKYNNIKSLVMACTPDLNMKLFVEARIEE